jgi:predicted GNAT family N-acyltransferase
MATILVATTDIEQGACAAIRHQVFVLGQNVPIEREYDGLDEDALHYIAFDDGQAVGTARLRLLDDEVKIERVAVVTKARGQGIATQLMEQMLADVREDGRAKQAVLGSQTYIVGLYEKLGFKKTGPIYEDAGLPHVDMVLAL